MIRFYKKIEEYRNYLFLFLLIVLYLILDYQTILFLRPQGIHFIRQTDGLSFVANYFKNGFNFFQPQVFCLQSIDGKAACEFPILYYLTAIFYLIFNEHEFILRIITIIIASTGFLFLFKLIYTFFQDLVYSLSFSFLFISSTVLLYYTNNFLPDASALGLTLTGWYFFFKFIINRNNKKSLFACFVFFSLSSLIKVTYFINPITAILSIIVYAFSKKTVIKNIFKTNATSLIYFTISLLLVLCWNLYINYYNKINQDNYFLIHSLPIWEMSKYQIAEVWDYITNYWYSKYYFQSTFHVFFILVVASIIFFQKAEKIILIPSVLLAIGSICYVLLFFFQFKDHDYYFITLIPAIIFLIMNSFLALKNKFPKLINNNIVKLLSITLCILSLNYAREKLIQRYENTNDKYSIIGHKLSRTRYFLDSLGISENAKVIIIADHTPNGGLYFINRRGWSLGDTSEMYKIIQEKYIRQGADYVLFTDKNYNNNFNGIKIGESNGILIYKLKNDM